jgi:hypothetical protein
MDILLVSTARYQRLMNGRRLILTFEMAHIRMGVRAQAQLRWDVDA